MHQPLGGGKYRTYTWAEVRDRVQWTAVGLSTIGVEIGDMVALQSETRAEFYFADLGVMAAGAISAALYTSLPYAEQAHALRFCEARVAMVENPKAMQGLQAALAATKAAPISNGSCSPAKPTAPSRSISSSKKASANLPPIPTLSSASAHASTIRL